MPQRDLLLARLLRDRAVERVEALEPRVRVVVAVRVLAVAEEIAGELDLVRRVVREEPRLRSTAVGRPGGRPPERRAGRRRTPSARRRPSAARRGEAAPRAAASATRTPASKPAARSASGSHSRSAPRTSGANGPVGSTVPGPEVPRIGAEHGNDHEHEHAERAQQQHEVAARHALRLEPRRRVRRRASPPRRRRAPPRAADPRRRRRRRASGRRAR